MTINRRTGKPGTKSKQPPERGAELLVRRLSPKTMAAAYLIWCDCQMHGWDRTATEMAETTGMTHQRIARTLALKGWLRRTRASHNDTRDVSPVLISRDDAQLHDIPEIAASKPWIDAA